MTNEEIAIHLAHVRTDWPEQECSATVMFHDGYLVRHIGHGATVEISGLEVASYIQPVPKILHTKGGGGGGSGRYTPKKGTIGKDPDTGKDRIWNGTQWDVWDGDLKDHGHPSKERRDIEPPTYEQLRRAFHERVIRVGSNKNHVRMVGHAELKDYDGNGESGKMIRLWFPEKVFENNEGKLDYNLVFSLASDGRHYLVADRDQPTRGTTSNIWLPSTTNWHEYGTVPITWETVRGANTRNQSYLKQISRSGMAAVRPPWIFKDDSQELKPMKYYGDIEPWQYEDKPLPESPELAWENLGWDDE